jgi:hypothetical protein
MIDANSGYGVEVPEKGRQTCRCAETVDQDAVQGIVILSMILDWAGNSSKIFRLPTKWWRWRKTIPQGLKPYVFWPFAARLKPCPDTNHGFFIKPDLCDRH